MGHLRHTTALAMNRWTEWFPPEPCFDCPDDTPVTVLQQVTHMRSGVLDHECDEKIEAVLQLSGEGYLLIRDDTDYELVQAAFARLALIDWYEVDPDEGVEPYEFADGGVGVKVHLYKDPAAQEVADGTATAGR